MTKLTFLAPAATAADPHQGVQERVSLVSSLHRKIDPVFVGVWVDGICHGGIVDLVQDILGASQPSVGFHNDPGGRFVRRLKHVARTQAGIGLLGHNLRILSTGLRRRELAYRRTKRCNVAHQNNALAPSAGPLTADKRHPVAMAPDARAD